MLRSFQACQLLLYLAACCYAGYRAVNEIHIAVTESEPAAFTAADFAERHRDEQWVCVDGRVAVEQRYVRPSRYDVHKGKNLVYVTAPIVAEDWRPQEPINILATFGPMPRSSVESWSRKFQAETQSVQGQLRPGGVRDPKKMFPQLLISSSYVIINDGTKPKHIGAMGGFLALMVFAGGLFVLRIRSIAKGKELSIY